MNTSLFILNQGHKKQGRELHIHTKLLISHTRNDPSFQLELKPSFAWPRMAARAQGSLSAGSVVGKGHSLTPHRDGHLGPKQGNYVGASPNSHSSSGCFHLVPCLFLSVCHVGLTGAHAAATPEGWGAAGTLLAQDPAWGRERNRQGQPSYAVCPSQLLSQPEDTFIQAGSSCIALPCSRRACCTPTAMLVRKGWEAPCRHQQQVPACTSSISPH